MTKPTIAADGKEWSILMPHGYNGKILHVDLTNSRLEMEEPSQEFYRKYMGGSAMGMYYILRDTPVGVDPLAPENVLTVMASVVTGALISGQSRVNVNARSPLTGTIGDSQSGGFFPANLKFAGIDGMVINGRSPKPVYLTVIDGKAEFRDAGHLMGKLTGEVEAILKEKFDDPKIHILQYGPGAENGVLYSALMSMANRANGRTGMGLVMASKNLKAIVVKGTKKMEMADRDGLKAIMKAGPGLMKENEDVDGCGTFGTAMCMNVHNEVGAQPYLNYNQGQWDRAVDISGETMSDTILLKRDTCYACIVRCKRVVEVTEPPYKVDPLYGGPEFETLSTFGTYCGINDLAAVSRANQVCNEYGVDTISCGATISFAMECFEKGIIGLEETGGLELRFGDADVMLEVLQQIVTNSGALGPVLSQGSARAAEKWGPEAAGCLVTVKGLEAPAHMPQWKKGLGLIYAVNPFGADHQSSEHDPNYEEGSTDLILGHLAEIDLTEVQKPESLEPEKVRFAIKTQIFYSLLDTLELCQFVWGPAWSLYGPLQTVELVRTVTGWDVSIDELMRVGERRLNMLRAYNAREGFGRKDDKLPKKFFKTLEGSGPFAGKALDKEEYERAISLYYEMADWTEDGVPAPAKMLDLGLEWVEMPS